MVPHQNITPEVEPFLSPCQAASAQGKRAASTQDLINENHLHLLLKMNRVCDVLTRDN